MGTDVLPYINEHFRRLIDDNYINAGFSGRSPTIITDRERQAILAQAPAMDVDNMEVETNKPSIISGLRVCRITIVTNTTDVEDVSPVTMPEVLRRPVDTATETK